MTSAAEPALRDDVNRTIETVWRMEAPRLIAALTRLVRDVGAAEDLAQDALVIALEKWPQTGVPANPGAWLMGTAKHRAVDLMRRRRMLERKHAELGPIIDETRSDDVELLHEAIDDDIGDDLLKLVFMTCHPVLSTDARVALTLRLLGGLTTGEIARAFLSQEPTIAQRILRAKKTLADSNIPFEVPAAGEREARLSSVLEVIYLIFNEGYSATSGDDWTRPALCEEAMRLGRVLAGLIPDEAEVHGLAALMELHASRLRARTGKQGEAILLMDQDRSKWDRLLINHGLLSLDRARSLGGTGGVYTTQASIAACHARAPTADETDWRRIAALYERLEDLMPSPVIELNRAVAVSMAYGAEAGLSIVDTLVNEPSLKSYHLLPSVRGDLLARLGRNTEAATEFERAAALTQNTREREILLNRIAALS